MKYYCVIDTNVLVSSFYNANSLPAKIISMCIDGEITPLLNEEIIAEYLEVTSRDKFDFDPAKVSTTISRMIEKSYRLDRTQSDDLFIDESDRVFYEIVLTGRQSYDAMLVTGNAKHFPIKHFVVTPRQMIEIIEKDKNI